MRLSILACAAVAALFSTAAFAQSPPLADAAFVAMAAAGNVFEIEESKLALEKATDSRLKGFAQHMIDDHGAALRKLQDAAGKANIKAEPVLDPPHQAMLDNLKTFSGTDFDKVYTADQVQSHADTAALLLDYKQNGKNGDLKSWSTDTLPAVQEHRATIDAM